MPCARIAVDLGRVVGQQPQLVHPEVERARPRRPRTRGRRSAGRARAARRRCRGRGPAARRPRSLAPEAHPAALVAAHVDDDAALGGDPLERAVELRPAVAALRAEHVAGEALGVHPHERRPLGDAERADEREVLDAGQHVAVGQRAEGAVARGQHGVGHPHDAVVALPPRDEVGDGDAPAGRWPPRGPARRACASSCRRRRRARRSPRPAPARRGGTGRRRPRCARRGRALRPARARSGTTCPGRMRSSAPARGSDRVRIVCARSAAEMPVDTPDAASTVTVYAVRRGSRLSRTMSGRSSRSATSSVTGAQM